MLFATLDPTTRRVQLPKKNNQDIASDVSVIDANRGDNNNFGTYSGGRSKGQEILLTDTVGFISKLPTNLIAAFRSLY
jgi:50S ribosomal subunit-associated GTPase HflX